MDKANREEIEKMVEALRLGHGGADEKTWKFWSTQPVPKMSQNTAKAGLDGKPLEADKDIADIRKNPFSLPKGFEWSDIDVTNKNELKELYTLLNENYVEDEDAMFRFDYSPEFLKWALLPPGFKKEWHIGIRVESNKKLVAFISGIPAELNIGNVQKKVAEINYLCVHKDMRSKRVAPVLIKEVTRRVNLTGVFQAVYTAGVELPKPVSKARYYHRSLQIKKLLEVKFTQLGNRQTMNMMKKLYRLPDQPSLPGFRPLKEDDIPDALRLLKTYPSKMHLSPNFTQEEFKHWFLPRNKVVYSYVIEHPESKKITDFMSFYSLPSTVMTTDKHDTLFACYSFYNVVSNEKDWKPVMNDMLVAARNAGFDVYNALESMDNLQFLKDLKFGPGDGELHYYLYNWMVKDIPKENLGLILL